MANDFLDLSLDNLDEQALSLPRRVYAYGVRLARAKRDAKLAARRQKVCYAKLYKKVTDNPDAFDLVKSTEEAVKQCVLRHPDYDKAEAELIEAEYQSDLLLTAVSALSAKKSMMEDLVRLHGQMYFSKLNVSGEDHSRLRQKQMRRDAPEDPGAGLPDSTPGTDDDDIPF